MPTGEEDILPPAHWPDENGLEHTLPDRCICLVRMTINDAFDHYHLEWCLPNRKIEIPEDLNIFKRCEDLVSVTAIHYNVKMQLSEEARGYFTSYQAMFSIRGSLMRTSKNASEGAEEGISPWKLGMLAACLLLWDVMWRRVAPYCREKWTVQVAHLRRAYTLLAIFTSIRKGCTDGVVDPSDLPAQTVFNDHILSINRRVIVWWAPN